MKVTVVGAGNVGATCADVLAYREVANEIVLLDIKEGLAEGKSLDIWQKAPIDLYDSRTIGATNDYTKSAGSDVVVITSGLPRKPGMSRDDLIGTNAGIVKSVTENIVKHSPRRDHHRGIQSAGCNDVSGASSLQNCRVPELWVWQVFWILPAIVLSWQKPSIFLLKIFKPCCLVVMAIQWYRFRDIQRLPVYL